MSKHIKFEKRYVQTNDSMMRVTIKEDGIILGNSTTMTIKEVEQWINSAKEFIKEKKDDIKVAEESIKLFKKEFEK